MSAISKKEFLEDVISGLKCKGDIFTMFDIQTVIIQTLQYYDLQKIETEKTETNLEAFLNAKKVEGRTARTIVRYKYIITRLLKFCKCSEREISVLLLRDYFTHMKNKGVSDRTLDGDRQVFSSYFGWLFRERLINVNPCDNLNAIKYPKKVRKPFDQVEIEKMKDSCKTVRNKLLINFLLSTGCRIDETCHVKIQDIRMSSKECVVMGKGQKERTVYLNDVTCDLLKRYLELRKDNSEWLFVGRGNKRLEPGGVRVMLKSIEKISGVANIHPHRFRRTLATSLIKHGMPIQEVARILGHDKIDTTMQYVYLDDRSVKDSFYRYS